MIVAAAIRINNAVISMAAPYRHHDILRQIAGLYDPEDRPHWTYECETQGFITDKGEFLNRREAFQHAIEGARVSDDKLLNGLRVRELAAIEAFRTGTAGLQEWADMTGVLNVCETMARSGIGPEALDACKKAEQALIDAGVRFESLGRMVMSGEGLQALRDLYAYHDLQRQSVSRAEFWRQIERAQKRVKSKAPEVRDMSEV